MTRRLNQRNPPPRYIKDPREPDPRFKPKWVIWQRRLFGLAGILTIIFVLAVSFWAPALVLSTLFSGWLVMSAALPMRHLPGILRLVSRTFPALTVRTEGFIDLMEYDLDWDSGRK